MSVLPNPWPAVVAVLVLLLGAGGCGVEFSSGNPPKTSPKKERVLEAGEGTWDLRTPPSREEAGMPDGQEWVIYEPHGWWPPPLRAHVLLPEGKRLDTEASYVALDSYGAACWKRTKTSDPTTMDISVGILTIDEARRELLRAAEEFGFSRRAIEEWYSEAKKAAASGDATMRVRSYMPDVEVGYLGVGVQGRFLPYEHEVKHAFVHYTLSWVEPFDPKACERLEETTGEAGTDELRLVGTPPRDKR